MSTLSIIRQKELLRKEYEAEKEDYRIQSEKMGIDRKVKRGICWWCVSLGNSYYNSLNQLVIEIFQDEPSDIEHNFEYGKPICFFTVNDKGNTKYLPYTCQVSYVEDNKMVVSIPSTQALIDIQNCKPLGVQLYFDETSYRTMFSALDDVINAKKNRLAELRDIFDGEQKIHKYVFNPLGFPWLNTTQEKAVNEVLWAKDVEIVHGPPGTGKTTTLVEAIFETLRREAQVMVCAQNNMAVDWISEKLVDRGIPILRIGNPSRVNDKMLSFTYERKFESHPDYPELWSIRKSIRQIKANGKATKDIHQKISRLKDRAEEIEMKISSSLFNEARVVSCTLVGSANKLLVGHKFSTLFIDEAAQALEAACWIAIRRADRVIFAGDHQQLPPTIKCYEALREGLGKTLMERIAEKQPDAVSLLKVQYRMNESIMRFSSDWFYNGEVKSAPDVYNRGILDYDTPIVWIDTSDENQIKGLIPEKENETEEELSFREEFIGENHGRINKAEGLIAIYFLENYIKRIGKERYIDERLDVGVISPYKVQTHFMRSLVKNNDFLKPIKRSITINTVDGFQGQERDIIIISLVRSNENGEIGFLNDLRRMNVAMTRARMKLVIIGDSSTLNQHKFYRKLKEYVDKQA